MFGELELLLLTINETSGQLAHVVEVDTDELALDKSQDEHNSARLENVPNLQNVTSCRYELSWRSRRTLGSGLSERSCPPGWPSSRHRPSRPWRCSQGWRSR